MNMKAITRINRRADNRTERLSLLTGRERQIMNLVSEGLSNKEIARKVKLADGTIKVHLHHVFEKLGISNRTSLAALAIRQEGRK
jgi:two-component system nitrate/nitrite response regulator NarL